MKNGKGMVAIAVIVALSFTQSPQSVSAETLQQQPEIVLAPAEGEVGATVQVTGSVFTAGQTSCEISFNGVRLASCAVNERSELEGSFTVPASRAGTYTVTVCNGCETTESGDTGEQASASFTIVAPPKPAPPTTPTTTTTPPPTTVSQQQPVATTQPTVEQEPSELIVEPASPPLPSQGGITGVPPTEETLVVPPSPPQRQQPNDDESQLLALGLGTTGVGLLLVAAALTIMHRQRS